MQKLSWPLCLAPPPEARYAPTAMWTWPCWLPRPLLPEARLALMAELSMALRREVDLVDLHDAWGLILRQVLTTGTLALKRSDAAHAALLKRMLLDQADMEPLRQRIIEKSLERGF